MDMTIRSRMWKSGTWIVMMLALVMVLAACSSSNSGETTETNEESGTSEQTSQVASNLVGTWTGKDAAGKEVQAVFAGDNTVTVNGGNKLYYKVYTDIEPNQALITAEPLTAENESTISVLYTVSIESATSISLKDDEQVFEATTLTKQ